MSTDNESKGIDRRDALDAPSLQGIGPADVARSRRCGVSLTCQEICYVLYLAT